MIRFVSALDFKDGKTILTLHWSNWNFIFLKKILCFIWHWLDLFSLSSLFEVHNKNGTHVRYPGNYREKKKTECVILFFISSMTSNLLSRFVFAVYVDFCVQLVEFDVICCTDVAWFYLYCMSVSASISFSSLSINHLYEHGGSR